MNEKLGKIKKEYLKITASDKLKDRISSTLKKNKKYRINYWRKTTVAAACLVFAFLLSLNISQSLAATIAEIPGMNEFVKFVTLERYVVDDPGVHADINTPQIEGLLDQELQDKINQDFKDTANALIIALESDTKELKAKFPNEEVNLGINYGYIVKTDNESILAIDVYMENTVGSSSTTHKFYTIDKKTKTLVTLSSLFKKDSDYKTKISEYIRSEMRRQNEKGGKVYWVDDATFGPFKGITEDQNFYINQDGRIVICFDKYEVAPGSTGSPEFVIPEEVVKEVLK